MTFKESLSPGYELMSRCVQVLRDDGDLNAMVFSIVAQLDPVFDRRIWDAQVDLTEFSPEIRTALPRVLVMGQEEADILEQVDLQTNSAPVTIRTYCFAQKDQPDLAEQLDARVKFVLLSTQLSNARIITAELYPVGGVTRRRESDFNDAFNVSRQYRSVNVGVLA